MTDPKLLELMYRSKAVQQRYQRCKQDMDELYRLRVPERQLAVFRYHMHLLSIDKELTYLDKQAGHNL